ncbi:MAG TPA: hypothetical protein VFX70_17035 [Mycobacteriales bacterium]|nr:hypothetical protein [Mycobacteriales bacterium]
MTGPAVVVGAVSPLGRLAGVAAVAAALTGLAAPALPLVVRSGGSGVGAAANAFDFLPPLVVAVVLGAAGVSCVRGTLPRMGLAAIGTAGAASVGLLLQTLFLADAGRRTSRDLPLPEAMVRTFRYHPAGGLHLRLAAEALAVAALVLVLLAWPRTWMEDDGAFDRRRPLFGGLGLFVGFVAAGGVCLALGDSDTPAIGPQSLLGRTGLDIWGTAALALALLLGGVVAASLRPRLAAVGAYAGLAAVTGGYALRAALLVARSTALRTSVGGVVLLVGAVGFAALAAGAWRTSPETATSGDRAGEEPERYAPGDAARRDGRATVRRGRGAARRS